MCGQVVQKTPLSEIRVLFEALLRPGLALEL